MTRLLVRARTARPRAAAALLALLAPLVVLGALADSASAFDPATVAATAYDPAFDIAQASAFRVNLQNLTWCAWRSCTATEDPSVVVNVSGPDRLSGSIPERYSIHVSGVPAFHENFTRIAVVLKGDTPVVTLQVDASGERTGDLAYTSAVNGSARLNVTLIPTNQTGNITMYVVGYVGEGNRSTLFPPAGSDATPLGRDLYGLVVKEIRARPQRMLPINVTISNDANVSVNDVTVAFFAKGPRDADYTPIGNASIRALNARGQADAGVVWDATWADAGLYTIKAVVDPLHRHAEAFEDNNVIYFQVNLGTPSETPGASAGQIFFWATLVTVIAVIGAIAWYNYRYE